MVENQGRGLEGHPNLCPLSFAGVILKIDKDSGYFELIRKGLNVWNILVPIPIKVLKTS